MRIVLLVTLSLAMAAAISCGTSVPEVEHNSAVSAARAAGFIEGREQGYREAETEYRSLVQEHTAGERHVGVTLQEWSLTVTPNVVPSGIVEFTASNIGPYYPHQVDFYKTDLPIVDVKAIARNNPLKRGFVPERDIPGLEFVTVIEDIEVGQNATAELLLTRGRYILLCNIVEDQIGEDGHPESHFLNLMWAEFFVT